MTFSLKSRDGFSDKTPASLRDVLSQVGSPEVVKKMRKQTRVLAAEVTNGYGESLKPKGNVI